MIKPSSRPAVSAALGVAIKNAATGSKTNAANPEGKASGNLAAVTAGQSGFEGHNGGVVAGGRTWTDFGGVQVPTGTVAWLGPRGASGTSTRFANENADGSRELGVHNQVSLANGANFEVYRVKGAAANGEPFAFRAVAVTTAEGERHTRVRDSRDPAAPPGPAAEVPQPTGG